MLTTEQVNAASSRLVARATGAIDTLEGQKDFFGNVFGNNDTVSSVQGALRMIRDRQIPGWKQNGLDLADEEDDASPIKVQGWIDLGQTFAQKISEIDKDGEDATLKSVVVNTVRQTGTDVVEGAKKYVFPAFGVALAIALVAVAGFFYLKTR